MTGEQWKSDYREMPTPKSVTPGCSEICAEKNSWDDVYIPGMRKHMEKNCWSEGHTAYLPRSDWDIALQVSGVLLWCIIIALAILAVVDFIGRAYRVLETLEKEKEKEKEKTEEEKGPDDEDKSG